MTQQKIEAHRITKPIQLLAAWLVGLSVVNITFLTAAATICSPTWIPALLSIASVVNVPVFVISIFILQTKFRPEMQEDSYYSDYLNRKTLSDGSSKESREEINKRIESLSNKISELAESDVSNLSDEIKNLISEDKLEQMTERHGNSRILSELFMRPHKWNKIVERWGSETAFNKEIVDADFSGLVDFPRDDSKNAALTELGKEISTRAQKKGILFAQTHKEYFEKEFKS